MLIACEKRLYRLNRVHMKKFPCQGNLDSEFAHNNPDMGINQNYVSIQYHFCYSSTLIMKWPPIRQMLNDSSTALKSF